MYWVSLKVCLHLLDAAVSTNFVSRIFSFRYVTGEHDDFEHPSCTVRKVNIFNGPLCWLLRRLLISFRPWLDGARLMLLLLTHIGKGISGLQVTLFWPLPIQESHLVSSSIIQTSHAPQKVRLSGLSLASLISSSTKIAADEEGGMYLALCDFVSILTSLPVCRLLNMYILIANWVIPALRTFHSLPRSKPF